jgi:hypothetical protein
MLQTSSVSTRRASRKRFSYRRRPWGSGHRLPKIREAVPFEVPQPRVNNVSTPCSGHLRGIRPRPWRRCRHRPSRPGPGRGGGLARARGSRPVSPGPRDPRASLPDAL